MEEKKIFQKPSMQVVELKSKVRILAGSDPGCTVYNDCGDDEEELCMIFDPNNNE